MKYEIMVYGSDPFDIMCGDCPVHEISWWEEITLDELHDRYDEEVSEDATIPAFDDWLAKNITDGYIRTVV